MPTEPVEPTIETPPANAPTPPAATEKVETDWKAEARKWEARSKENSKAAEQLAAIEEANKTEAQRLEDRAAAAEKALVNAQLESTRNAIALEKGLTASQAKRLVGNTPEELAADADDLLADLGKPSTAPRADLSQGPKTNAGVQSPAQVFADFLTNAKNGN